MTDAFHVKNPLLALKTSESFSVCSPSRSISTVSCKAAGPPHCGLRVGKTETKVVRYFFYFEIKYIIKNCLIMSVYFRNFISELKIDFFIDF